MFKTTEAGLIIVVFNMNTFVLCTKPHSFIHSHCAGVNTPKHYSAVSEGLAQGSYMTARVGFEHATIRTQGIEPTTELPRSTLNFYGQRSTLYCIFYLVPVFVSKLK